MTDEFDDLEDEVQGERPPLDPNIRKQLREAEKAKQELKDLKAELEAQKREVLFSKAGVPDEGVGKYFRKGYDGEVSIEAIKSAYGELSPEPVIESYDAELAALQRTQGATVGNSGAMPDPQQEFLEKLAASNDPTEVMAIIRGDSGRKVGLFAAGEQF